MKSGLRDFARKSRRRAGEAAGAGAVPSEPLERASGLHNWEAIGVGVVLAISLLFRLLFLAGRHFRLVSDMATYDQRALVLLQQHTFDPGGWAGSTYRGPGYIVFLAATYGLAGHHIWVVYALQSLLGTAMLFGIYLLGKRLFSTSTALVALILAGGYLPFLAYNHLLMTETLFMTLVVFAVYAVVRSVQDGSLRWLAIAGVLCALASLTRSQALLLLVPLILWALLSKGRALLNRRLAIGLVVLLGSMALVISPWAIRNWVQQGMFIPTDSVGGLNLFIGNHDGANGYYDEKPLSTDPAVLAAKAEGKRDGALDAVMRKEAIKWITAHPVRFLSLSGKRAYLFIAGTSDDWLIRELRSHTLDTVMGWQRYYHYLLVALGVIGGLAGVVVAGRRTLLPLLLAVFFLLTVSFFYFQVRYRLPLMPFVILMAAYAVELFRRGAMRAVTIVGRHRV